MTFVPQYSAAFEGPIIDNVITIVTRDMKGALDFFNPTEALLPSTDPAFLADFAERSIGTEHGFEFPIFVIGPEENTIAEAEDESRLGEDIKITMNIGIVDDTSEKAYRRCMKYVRALDAVLRSATKNDYCANMTNGSNVPFGLSKEVSHFYRPLGVNDERTIYFKPATIRLALTFNER